MNNIIAIRVLLFFTFFVWIFFAYRNNKPDDQKKQKANRERSNANFNKC